MASNYSGGSAGLATFGSRDPAAEMADAVLAVKNLTATGGNWRVAEAQVGEALTERYVAASTDIGANARSQYQSIIDKIKTEVYGSTTPTTDVAYSQYINGLSASFGGGHSNVSSFINLASQQRQMEVNTLAASAAQTVLGQTMAATSAMPLVVPLESQLFADAAASACESRSIAAVRTSQLAQSHAMGSILSSVTPELGTNANPIEYTLMLAGVRAQGAAASTG